VIVNSLADKAELRRLMSEQNDKMGFVRILGATAQKAREMMLASGIHTEDNEATRELLRVPYGTDVQEGFVPQFLAYLTSGLAKQDPALKCRSTRRKSLRDWEPITSGSAPGLEIRVFDRAIVYCVDRRHIV